MSDPTSAATIELTLDSASRVAVEVWRLKRWIDQSPEIDTNPVVRRTMRSMYELLRLMELEVVDFTGKVYDAGMAPEVIDVQFDDSTTEGAAIVVETIMPTVMWKKQMILGGQIIVRRPQADLH